MKRQLPNKMVGKAWIGVWNEPQRQLGWAVPNFIEENHVNQLNKGEHHNDWAQGEFWKCKVTIELLKDKRGRAYRKVVGTPRW